MADELIELGSPGTMEGAPKLAGPFLSHYRGEKPPGAPAPNAELGAYLGARLTAAVDALSAASGAPSRILAAGTPWAQDSLGACLTECPALGALAAQVVYLAGVLQDGRHKAPGWDADALGKTAGAYRAALAAAYPADGPRLGLYAEAQSQITKGAPAGLRASIE